MDEEAAYTVLSRKVSEEEAMLEMAHNDKKKAVM